MAKDNEIVMSNKKELKGKESALAILSDLPDSFPRVDFTDPESMLYYGHDDKDAISNILVRTAQLSVNEARTMLSDEMIKKIYSFDESLDESDRKANKKELAIVKGFKGLLTSMGVKKFEKEKEANSYQARYKDYCDNIEEVCRAVEGQMQASISDIHLRQQIALEMRPYLEHLEMTIKVGEADYILFVEETNQMKSQELTEDLDFEIKQRELIQEVFHDKLDKLRKVFTAYKQQLLVYAEQQHNEMTLIQQQQSYIEDQKPILMVQGSSMIFNREQQNRASDLQKLNDATNRAYQENAAAIIQNTETIADLKINGGIKTESIETLQSAIAQGIAVINDTRQQLEARIENDTRVLAEVNSASDEYAKELEGLNTLIEGVAGKTSHRVKRLGRTNGNAQI